MTSHPSEHLEDLWILKAIFGASLFFLAAFWALMLILGPAGSGAPRETCFQNQATVQAAFRKYCAREGLDFATLLRKGKRGARLAPLIEELRSEGLLPSPPPSTGECRSWKDYMVLDLIHPTPEKISCRMHGIPETTQGGSP